MEQKSAVREVDTCNILIEVLKTQSKGAKTSVSPSVQPVSIARSSRPFIANNIGTSSVTPLTAVTNALPPSQLACRLLLYDFRRRHVKAIQGFKMKLKVVCRKVYDYVRYDLKEIAFPSSLPDPPGIKKRRKLTWKESYLVLKEASRLYAASWVRDIGPELRPNDYKKKQYTDDMDHEENDTSKGKEPSTLEDLAVAARGGMETLRPALQRVYMTRASAYRDALKSFIVGYQEGIQQVMDKKEEATKSQEEKDVNKGP